MALAVEGGGLVAPTPLVDKGEPHLTAVESPASRGEEVAQKWLQFLQGADQAKGPGEIHVGLPADVREEMAQAAAS